MGETSYDQIRIDPDNQDNKKKVGREKKSEIPWTLEEHCMCVTLCFELFYKIYFTICDKWWKHPLIYFYKIHMEKWIAPIISIFSILEILFW